jgi:hypothetical protein
MDHHNKRINSSCFLSDIRCFLRSSLAYEERTNLHKRKKIHCHIKMDVSLQSISSCWPPGTFYFFLNFCSNDFNLAATQPCLSMVQNKVNAKKNFNLRLSVARKTVFDESQKLFFMFISRWKWLKGCLTLDGKRHSDTHYFVYLETIILLLFQ